MSDVQFCTRCVISTERPLSSREYARAPGSRPATMTFDAEGVCGACRVAERKAATDWPAREEALRWLCAQHRRTDGRPDVLVPGSGGKDSVYAAHILKTRYGMHPLTVTWAPHEYTAVGWRNFQRWLGAGFDNLLVTPNPRVHRLLTRLAFTNLLHPFQPFVLGQRSLASKLAARYNIRLIFFGEDDEEYEGAPGWQEQREELTRPLREIRLGGVPYTELITQHGLDPHDLWMYLPPEPYLDTIQALGRYLRWVPQEAYYYAVEHTGFEANEARTEGTYSKYNSIDDRLDPLHYYTTWIKFGLGRASYDAAQEIRNGHLTRAEGVALVRQYDGEIRPETVAWACGYMGITEPEFWETVDRFRPARLWTRHEPTWTLGAHVW